MENLLNRESMTPSEARSLIRAGAITCPTAGMCNGFAQGNLVVLPKKYAYDFLLFTERNPKSCPILEVTEPGSRCFNKTAADSDIAKDLPKYRIYEKGELIGEYTDVEEFWRDDLVSFLIGCSFSFESALLSAGVPVRHIEENKNVPMFITDIDTVPAGMFSGKTVVSMRPLKASDAIKAVQITSDMPRVHGAPIHIGDPALIGIKNINNPDFGDAVTINADELPVFWCCGVTPQAAVLNSKPDFAITHSPGHMFITDVLNEDLKN